MRAWKYVNSLPHIPTVVFACHNTTPCCCAHKLQWRQIPVCKHWNYPMSQISPCILSFIDATFSWVLTTQLIVEIGKTSLYRSQRSDAENPTSTNILVRLAAICFKYSQSDYSTAVNIPKLIVNLNYSQSYNPLKKLVALASSNFKDLLQSLIIYC